MARSGATVQWLPRSGEDPLIHAFASPIIVGPDSDPGQIAAEAYAELLSGRRPS